MKEFARFMSNFSDKKEKKSGKRLFVHRHQILFTSLNLNTRRRQQYIMTMFSKYSGNTSRMSVHIVDK